MSGTMSPMNNKRLDKVNELLRREISTVLQRDFEWADTLVTITGVEVTEDLREAKVWVSIIGKKPPQAVIEKLNERHGYIQNTVSKRVVLRNTPRLFFRLDNSAERGVALVNLLDDIDQNLPKAPEDPDDPRPL